MIEYTGNLYFLKKKITGLAHKTPKFLTENWLLGI